METWDVRSLEIEPHHPQVLRSDDETRAIAISLPAGEELQEHQVHERAYLIVVEGEVSISSEAESVSGGAGLLAHFAPNERRTIRAASDARLLLVLAPWPGAGREGRAGGAPAGAVAWRGPPVARPVGGFLPARAGARRSRPSDRSRRR